MSENKTEVIIDVATPESARRFNDISAEYINGRNVAFRPGNGSCIIKQSFDGGLTYDHVQTIDGSTIAGILPTFKRRIELECTGNAVIALAL